METSTTTLADGLMFPEGPRWHEDRLVFSDVRAQKVLALSESGALEVLLELDDMPSGLGWDPQGRMLVVSMLRRTLLRVDRGSLEQVADLTEHTRFAANDMLVDAEGGAWISSFGYDHRAGGPPEPAELVRVDPNGGVRIAARDLMFPNGMVLTDDGRILIVAESLGPRLTAFDVDSDASLSGRRVFADLPGTAPDGLSLVAAGDVWVAPARFPEVLRVRRGGAVTGRARVSSGSLPYACMLGGADGRTLFVCTAAGTRDGAATGRIEIAHVDVSRAGRP